MRLGKAQKEALLVWIAEGLRSDEINERAAEFDPPFAVSRRMVTYYRGSRAVEIQTLVEAGELEALQTGLARREVRVQHLKELAGKMEDDLLGDRSLWLPRVKIIGSGDNAELINYEEFNRWEIDAYRGVLDDISKELGHRGGRAQVVTLDVSALTVAQLERIASGEDPLYVLADSITGEGRAGAAQEGQGTAQ